ncbi:hypothetical protein [Horticoccus sp. 23ND18S-11]|uniref:hypothetical protein n=1 Tax=Horticoccus sp. 23ND18S-11 TaxID=3391832 RepID=UPI0039C937C5
MALYFAFVVECPRESDAIRICERLRTVVIAVAGRDVPMAEVKMEAKAGMWYVQAMPSGIGYSRYGGDVVLNRPESVTAVIDLLYEAIASEEGIRRALCGYEAQDAFEDVSGNPDLSRFDIHDLVYDRNAIYPTACLAGARKFGVNYYRNPSREHKTG